MEATRPPIITRAMPCIISLFLPIPSPMGSMERMVVRVVIRIGRRRMAPASISASSSGISCLSWLTVSTYNIPLFTTIPASIKNPIKETILMVIPAIYSRKTEPTRLKGIHIITMKEKRGDSNCMAITRKTRNTAIKMDW